MSGTISICEIKDENYVEWKIPQFFQSSHEIEAFKSSVSLLQKDCILYAYPSGGFGAMPDYVIVALHVLRPDKDFHAHASLETEGCEDAIKSKTLDGIGESGHYKIWAWLFESTKLKTLLLDDLLRGKVILSCREKESNKSPTAVAACQTTFLYNFIHFCPDFQELLNSGRHSDVSIEVQGRLFKVHKLILEACSPVFSAMFDHDMSEKNGSMVKVEDCDPDTFQDFLKCLYSGKLENTSPENLINLYMVSDKYGVSDLKEKCSEFMVKELSEDTVFDVLAVAVMCNDAQLKESAVTFLVKNIITVLRTETWKTFQSENPSFAAEILTKVFED